jgi:hypothetical protein
MLKETVQNGNIIDNLLLEMDNYAWSSVSRISPDRTKNYVNPTQLEGRASYFGMKAVGPSLRFDAQQIIRHSGITLDGTILEFDTGPTSIGTHYPNFIAVDNDPRNVKHLRQKGIKAIIGTIEELPFLEDSFDYVLAFSPLIVRGSRGWNRENDRSGKVEVSSDYKTKIVSRAIEIAKKKVLIASVPIAVDPPFIELAEKIVADRWHHYYYVVYRAG